MNEGETNLPSITQQDEDKLCKICHRVEFRYACPRCNVQYCSLECYRSAKHTTCSELFYKEQVLQHLPDHATEESRQKMLEILRRQWDQQQTREELDSDDEDVPDLAERIHSVDLDDAEGVWSILTESERQEFEALVNSGNAEKMLPAWEPWWTYREPQQLVEEIHTEPSKPPTDCPAHLSLRLQLTQVVSQPASPCVPYNICNALAAYVVTVRQMHGDVNGLEQRVAASVFAVSGNLRDDTNYPTLHAALDAAAHDLNKVAWMDSGPEVEASMRGDLSQILAGPSARLPTYYILSALADLYRILGRARKNKATENTQNVFCEMFGPLLPLDVKPVPEEKLLRCRRKLEFYSAWTQRWGEQTLCQLSVSSHSAIVQETLPH